MERQTYIDVCHTAPEFPDYGFDLVQVKLDGQWCKVTLRRGWAEVETRNGALAWGFPVKTAAECVLVGEMVLANGIRQVWVFDAPEAAGTYPERMAACRAMCASVGTSSLVPVPTLAIAETAHLWQTAVILCGGEGLVYRRSTDCYAGAIIGREKRVQTYDGACVEKSNRGLPVFDFEGVRQAIAGVPADECRPGRVAEFSAFARFASGKLRNPVFLRWRDDKEKRTSRT